MQGVENLSFWRQQFPAIVWAGVIFILSSIPGQYFRIPTLFPLDKFVHAGIFFIFCILLNRAFNGQTRSLTLSRYRLLISFLIVVVYGLTDEFHQKFVPGRTPDFTDAAADALGGLLATVYVYFRERSAAVQEGEGT